METYLDSLGLTNRKWGLIMTTEQIVESQIDSFMDCFYGYLIKEGMYNQMPDALKKLFAGINPEDIAFILDGIETKYFADYTYFISEEYKGDIYWAIPYGEIEVPEDEIDKDEIDNWCISCGYGYQTLPAITICYNLETVAKAIDEWLQ